VSITIAIIKASSVENGFFNLFFLNIIPLLHKETHFHYFFWSFGSPPPGYNAFAPRIGRFSTTFGSLHVKAYGVVVLHLGLPCPLLSVAILVPLSLF